MTKTRETLAPVAQLASVNQPFRALSQEELLAVSGGATRSSGNTVDKNYYVRTSGKNAKQGS